MHSSYQKFYGRHFHGRRIAACGKLTAALVLLLSGGGAMRAQSISLPDAPSTVLLASSGDAPGMPVGAAGNEEGGPQAAARRRQSPTGASTTPQCPSGVLADFVFMSQKQRAICQEQDPLQFIVEPGPLKPLTPTQKGELAVRGVISPFNLITIVGFSGVSVAANSHSAYGPGLKGWGRLMGYSLVEDIQGETTGTFLIPVLAHEYPRYHRLPGHPFPQRLLHAIVHTAVSQGDDGHIMPNYATLINYPLSAEISNLYVPGVATNAPSTAKRIVLGYATDPVGAIVAEFLPDVARRIHIRIIFAQQILNRIALGQNIGQQ
jgi:hypothetical protein